MLGAVVPWSRENTYNKTDAGNASQGAEQEQEADSESLGDLELQFSDLKDWESHDQNIESKMSRGGCGKEL